MSINIPDSVTTIEKMPFYDCRALQYVSFSGNKEPAYIGRPFSNCSKLNTVNVPYDYEKDVFCGVDVVRSLYTITYKAEQLLEIRLSIL